MKKPRIESVPTRGGVKRALTPDDVNTIGRFLTSQERWRDLVLFRTGIDTMLRASDLVRMRIDNVLDWQGDVLERVEILQQKTGGKVTVTLSARTRDAITRWIDQEKLMSAVWLFPGGRGQEHLSESQYRRLAKEWFTMAGLDARKYSTHSIRRTKASQIYEKTGNLEAIRQLLGHASLTHTQKYLGVDLEKALRIALEVKI